MTPYLWCLHIIHVVHMCDADPRDSFVQMKKRCSFSKADAVLRWGAWLGEGSVGEIPMLIHP